MPTTWNRLRKRMTINVSMIHFDKGNPMAIIAIMF